MQQKGASLDAPVKIALEIARPHRQGHAHTRHKQSETTLRLRDTTKGRSIFRNLSMAASNEINECMWL